MRSRVLAFLSAGAALVPLAVVANPIFTHAIDFGFATANKFGKDDALFTGGLNTLYSYDRPGLNFQFGGNYDHTLRKSADAWSGNGDLFWRGNGGSFGISGGYGAYSNGPARKMATSYGAFGEWYMLPGITTRLKGGAFDGDITGWYTGAGFEYYPTAYIGLSTAYNFTRINGGHIHNFDVNSEYLISRKYPLSVVIGYEHTETNTSTNEALMARLRFRIGIEGSLAKLDRNGPIGWDGLLPLR